MLDHAIAAARRGIRVFPLLPGGRLPARKEWQKIATTDEAVLRRWWDENPNYNPGGIAGLVIDVDVKHGKPGLASLENLDALDLLPPTYTQATPSGGRHLVYATEAGVPNSVERIAPGIDVRGRHGFVVLAGARVESGEYAVLDDAPVAPAPADLVALCGQQRERPAGAAGEGAFPDHPADIARAVEYLQREAPPAILGSGNTATYEVACQVRQQGVSEPLCAALMLEHWNARCEPPWDADELGHIVGNAYRYATGVAGEHSVAAQFGLEAESEDAPAGQEGPPGRFPFETVSDLRKLPPMAWLVPGWVPENALGVFYGKWGSGKSFLLLDLLLHVAYGLSDWHGVKLSGGPLDVLLVAREGHHGFVRRVDAFRKRHGLTAEPERLRFMRAPVSLMNEAEFKLLRSEIRASGIPFKLLALDTFARVMPGVDMNEQQHVTLLMERCQQLGEATGASVIGAHHQNKGGTMLGSTFFEANADFVFEVTRLGADAGPLSAGEIRCTKMKDGEDQWRRAVRYERVALEAESFEDGETPASLVVAAIEEIQPMSEGEAARPLEVLAEVLAGRLERKAWKLLDVQKAMSSAEKEAAGMTDEAVKSRNHTRLLAKLVDLDASLAEVLTGSGIMEIWRPSPQSGVWVRLK